MRAAHRAVREREGHVVQQRIVPQEAQRSHAGGRGVRHQSASGFVGIKRREGILKVCFCYCNLFLLIMGASRLRCNVSSIARAQRQLLCAQHESGIVGGAGGAGRAGSGLACRAHGQPALRGRARRPASRPHAGLRYLRRPRAAAPQLRSQCPSHALVPPQGAPGGSGQLSTPMKRLAHWAPSHCPRCSSPPKPPIDFTAFDHAGTA